ncbi:MAG: hypothetical protein V4508_15785 [Pseudomonadota bacterium]
MPLLSLFVCALLLALPGGVGAAERITLRLMALPDNNERYYTKLLEESLRATGYQLHIDYVRNVPQPRIWHMVEHNQLSLMWGVQTRARDAAYASVSNQLTGGLIGQRILLVRKGQEQAYAKVRNLEDFRRLGKTGGVGINWLDADVWKLNGLPVYVKTGDWRQLFPMVASGERGIDYVVRGASEIVNEIKHYDGLAVEANLVLIHDRDMHFYLSPDTVRYRAIIENALAQADKSGLKKELIARFILPDLKTLNLDQRVKIRLNTPEP